MVTAGTVAACILIFVGYWLVTRHSGKSHIHH